VTVALAACAATASAAPSDIQDKKAEAQQVLGEIAQIDASLETAVDAYNGAEYELGLIEQEITTNQRHLEVAKNSFKIAQQNLAQRIVTLYQDGEQDVIEIILGASNLDDLLDRIDTANRISSQDVQILESVRKAKAEIKERERRLADAHAKQQQVVADRAAQRDAIEAQLAERQQLYDSIKGQIQDLIAEERERQRRLAEEARRREAEAERIRELAVSAGVDTSVVEQIAVPTGIGTAPSSRLGGAAVSVALQYLGVPYVWGGMSPSGFDCSGLVAYAYAQVGISLPHHAATMFGYGVPVSYDELQPGDLVFANGLGHMGMYIGSGQYIHAPHTGDVVRIASMSSRSDWVGFRRVG
jgi:cell wall-associated NlpC family hydrolase